MLPARLPVDDAETLKALRSFNRTGVHKGHHSLQRAARFLEQGTSALHIPCYLNAFCKPISIQTTTILQPITIPELRLNHCHRGKVLRGHLRARAFKFIKTVASVFEDGSGHAARVLVSSLVFPDFATQDAHNLLPEGSELVIREPCLVESNIYCQGTCLWLSNPASMQVREASTTFDDNKLHTLPTDEEEFSNHSLRAAIQLYTRLVEFPSASDEERASIHSSRAEAWLRSGYPHRALEDVEQALKLSPGDERSLVTKARALWKLEQYVEAEACLRESLTSSSSALVEGLHEQARRFMEESSSGTHDLSEFIKGGCKKESAPVFAEYVGPVRVEMTKDGRGRGLFLTRDVRRGELVLVSNAAVRLALTEGLKDRLDRGDSSELLSQLLHVCMGSPRTLEQVYSMAEQDRVLGEGKLVEKPAPSMEIFKPDWDVNRLQEEKELELDVIRIQNILDCSIEFVLSEDYSDEYVGFWTLPAFINHSCLPNVCMRKFGGAMFVFAAREMKAGSELVRSYGYSMRPWSLRRSKSTFECRCRRCEVEKRVERRLARVSEVFMRLLKRREVTGEDCEEYASLAVEIEQVLTSLESTVSDAEKMWIRATYPAAYLAYHGCRDGSEVEEGMPSADELMEALHETAPGDVMTLAMMYRYRSGASERGMELLKREICAAFGHLECDVVESVMNHLETGRLAATT